LDSNGVELGGTAEPVRVAVENYLRSLPFNGEFSITALTDAVQRAKGVVLCQVLTSEARIGFLPYQPTGLRYIPDAGWMKLYTPSDLVVNYAAYTFNEYN
jgi:hypothetical protein